MTTCPEIEALLKRVIGLDANSTGATAVSMAVQARMKKRGIKELHTYVAILESSDAELQKLVEEVVVPETWFFRDLQPFVALAKWAVSDWYPSHPDGVLRLLSMPCSSGEEPFSIVMSLLDAGISPERFVVEAVDISGIALERAREGVFGQNSFRGSHLEFREKYFHQTSSGWKLSESVRNQVHFRQTNVLDPSFCSTGSIKDVIFCRNMLIYFDEQAQVRVMDAINSMLSPEGLLLVGHAEAYLFGNSGFRSAEMPMAFAFRRRDANRLIAPARRGASEPKGVRSVAPSVSRSAHLGAFPIKPTGGPRQASPKSILPSAERPVVLTTPTDPDALLSEGVRLANAGCFDAASEKCNAYLKERGPSGQAYCLLGLISDALGKSTESAALYKKALYLEPDYSDALVHLALLAEKSGDLKTSRQLRQRARRVQIKIQGKTEGGPAKR